MDKLKKIEAALRKTGHKFDKRDGWRVVTDPNDPDEKCGENYMRYATLKGENVLVTIFRTTLNWHVETLRHLDKLVVPVHPQKRSIYTEKIDKDADVYTVKDFKKHCEHGSFIDYDGMGSPAKKGKRSTNPDHYVYPSTLIIPKDATHIVWFNR